MSLAAGKIGVAVEGHLSRSCPQMSRCDSCPWKCRAEGGNGERTQWTNVHSNTALQAEGFKGRTNSRAQADRTANCHLLSLCRLSMLPSGDSDLGAGACCWWMLAGWVSARGKERRGAHCLSKAQVLLPCQGLVRVKWHTGTKSSTMEALGYRWWHFSWLCETSARAFGLLAMNTFLKGTLTDKILAAAGEYAAQFMVTERRGSNWNTKCRQDINFCL